MPPAYRTAGKDSAVQMQYIQFCFALQAYEGSTSNLHHMIGARPPMEITAAGAVDRELFYLWTLPELLQTLPKLPQGPPRAPPEPPRADPDLHSLPGPPEPSLDVFFIALSAETPSFESISGRQSSKKLSN